MPFIDVLMSCVNGFIKKVPFYVQIIEYVHTKVAQTGQHVVMDTTKCIGRFEFLQIECEMRRKKIKLRRDLSERPHSNNIQAKSQEASLHENGFNMDFPQRFPYN